MKHECGNKKQYSKESKKKKIIRIKGKNERKFIKQTEQKEDKWEAPKDL